MKVSLPILLLLLLPLCLAQGTEDTSIQTLIRQLASDNFKIRLAATNSLKERPEAEKALRKALTSLDLETRRRAMDVLAYYQQEPLRKLRTFVSEGRIDEFITLVSTWPPGEDDQLVWDALLDFTRKISALHEKNGGKKLNLRLAREEYRLHPSRPVLSAKLVTEWTKAPLHKSYFLRAREVDIDSRRRKPWEHPNTLEDSIIVASGSVLMRVSDSTAAIFAGGSITLEGPDPIIYAVIISGKDITLRDCGVGNSLIVARGKIVSTGGLSDSRIISGKTLSTTRKPEDCFITENEPNPLGFIRWSDPPKDKAPPKTK